MTDFNENNYLDFSQLKNANLIDLTGNHLNIAAVTLASV